MCKQNLLNLFPFVWIITVKFCYFIILPFTFFAACQRNLLAPATMEITFHQFGNYRILINKIFPMELVLEMFFLSFFLSSFFVLPSSFTNVGKKISFPISLTTLVHGGSINQPPTLTALPSQPPPKPSPQGSVLHRWVCSDTLVRLKSQAGFINSYSGSMDTPFCIVTNTRINPLCPGVLQNYISSYMIKSDWLHSAFPLRLSEISVCV